MKFKVCPWCGSHLDYGERCDCTDAAATKGDAQGAKADQVRKRGNTFIAYMTFINAVLGIASPSLMCMYAGGLKQAYEEGKI